MRLMDLDSHLGSEPTPRDKRLIDYLPTHREYLDVLPVFSGLFPMRSNAYAHNALVRLNSAYHRGSFAGYQLPERALTHLSLSIYTVHFSSLHLQP